MTTTRQGRPGSNLASIDSADDPWFYPWSEGVGRGRQSWDSHAETENPGLPLPWGFTPVSRPGLVGP